MSALALEKLSKAYGETAVVRKFSLAVAEGEFVSLLGPSGCGKTTILRMVAGLVEPSGGRILIGPEDVTRLPPNKRGIGLVFQSYALFPHLDVFENIAFGLRRRGISGAALETRVREALAMVRLDSFGNRFPQQLSGGQQQRIAIARALAPRPRLLLLDEPLSNLDAQLRDEMQVELKRLQRSLGITTLFVTHDQSEALSMSDRVCVLAGGVMQQFGTPEEVYHRPATAFVASFIGRPNRLSGVVETREAQGGSVRVGRDLLLPAADLTAPVGSSVRVVIRQEAIRIDGEAEPGGARLSGTVLVRSFSGARVQYLVRVADDVELMAEAPSTGADAALAVGASVCLNVDPGAVFAMPEEAAS
jgi:iron(III) transport system ATP-binding protein/putative spermidine/putrescine transport system ATP-binding protein